MQNILLSQICQKCGECCKNFPYVELSEIEINRLEKFTGLRFDLFTNPKGKTIEEYFLKFKENGDCIFLKEKNGKYFCSVYEARSKNCRNYPSDPKQNEVCRANREKIQTHKLPLISFSCSD